MQHLYLVPYLAVHSWMTGGEKNRKAVWLTKDLLKICWKAHSNICFGYPFFSSHNISNECIHVYMSLYSCHFHTDSGFNFGIKEYILLILNNSCFATGSDINGDTQEPAPNIFESKWSSASPTISKPTSDYRTQMCRISLVQVSSPCLRSGLFPNHSVLNIGKAGEGKSQQEYL